MKSVSAKEVPTVFCAERFRLVSEQLQVTCIELGLGISFIPSVSWRGQISDQIVLKRVADYKRTTYVYKNPYTCTSQYIKDFLEMVHEECNKERNDLNVGNEENF